MNESRRPCSILRDSTQSDSQKEKPPQKLAEVLKQLLSDFAPVTRHDECNDFASLQALWNQLSGDLSRFSEVRSYRKGVLTVACSGLPIVAELEFQRETLLKELSDRGLSKLHDLKFVPAREVGS